MPRRVLFSGDIGNIGRPLLRNPLPPIKVDIIVMETTYGDRLHKPFAPSLDEFYEAIKKLSGGAAMSSFQLSRWKELRKSCFSSEKVLKTGAVRRYTGFSGLSHGNLGN